MNKFEFGFFGITIHYLQTGVCFKISKSDLFYVVHAFLSILAPEIKINQLALEINQ